MATRSYLKNVLVTGSAETALSDAASEVRELADEMESWRDNMSGTALENTSKFEMVDEAASALSDLADSLENVDMDAFSHLSGETSWSVQQNVNKRRSVSRATRLSNAESAFEAAKSAVESAMYDLGDVDIEDDDDEAEQLRKQEAQDRKDGLESLLNELENIDEWSVDFPGMY